MDAMVILPFVIISHEKKEIFGKNSHENQTICENLP
jgi:hypothetical protein